MTKPCPKIIYFLILAAGSSAQTHFSQVQTQAESHFHIPSVVQRQMQKMRQGRLAKSMSEQPPLLEYKATKDRPVILLQQQPK